MSRRLGSFFVVVVAIGGLVLGQGSAAVAKTPSRVVDHSIGIFCDDPLLTNSSGVAFVDAISSSAFGPGGNMVYWAAPASPDSDPPTYQASQDLPMQVLATADHLEATIPLVNVNGDPAGSASVIADLVADGPAVASSDKGTEGNHHFSFSGTSQPLIVSVGSLSFGTVTFDLAGCSGSIDDFTEFSTNPNSSVGSGSRLFVDCQLVTPDYELDLFADPGAGFIDIAFFRAGVGIEGFGQEFTLTDQAFNATVPMSDLDSGASLGDAVVNATVSRGERISLQDNTSTQHNKLIGNVLNLSGTISVPTDPATVIDLSVCHGFDGRTQNIQNNPAGPKPGGKVPVNDTPSGAVLLGPRSSVTIQTGGATIDAEASCVDQLGNSLPIVRTVWYKVVGTGSSMTVDSAGSNFDTILGVYKQGSAGFDEVGCVDDVRRPDIGRTLQAAITFDTSPGATYFVQAGGFDDPQYPPFGQLKLHVS